MPKVFSTGNKDRVHSFSQYRPTLAGAEQFFFLLNSTKYFPADVKLTNSEKQGRDGGRRIEERCIILIDNNQT